MTRLDKGLRRRLDALPLQRLWDVAQALDVDPERLPHADRSRSEVRLAAQVRRAIRVDLRARATDEREGRSDG